MYWSFHEGRRAVIGPGRQWIVLSALLFVACLRPVTPGGRSTSINPPEPLYEVGGEVMPPVMIDSCLPLDADSYGEHSLLYIFEIIVSNEGRVLSVELMKSPEPPLGHSIATRLRQSIAACRFEPATRNGKPVAVRYVLTIRSPSST